jgi:hypothetical protein
MNMSHREKHIYEKKTCFYVDMSRGCKTVRRQFTFSKFGGREPSLVAARAFVASILELTLQEFYDLRLEPANRSEWHHPNKPRELRYIRKINTPLAPRVPYAWIVTVPGYRSRTFSFEKWGGEAKALAMAQAFRDAPTDARNLDDLLLARQNPGASAGAKGPSGDGVGQNSARGPEA